MQEDNDVINKTVRGLHHVTAMAADAQKNFDFYAGILGLRLVKKTVNFDAPEIYHLYYGDEKGSPGTLMTFFVYSTIPKGRRGKGQVSVTAFSIAKDSIDYWVGRLDRFQVRYQGPQPRFHDELVISLEDEDGLGLELVANSRDERMGFAHGVVPSEHAIKGLYGVTLSEEGYERTAGLLVGQMNHTQIDEKGSRFRYAASDRPGAFVDILCHPDELRGIGGTGTVHHVAFATANEGTQLRAREKLAKLGLNVTPVINREYFHSIYYREPGGVLFEIATLPPGFTVDESLDHLGETLKLPPWEEQNRKVLEQYLPPINTDLTRFSH